MSKSMWFDVREILSHNCPLNFVVGNRGGGKTYGSVKHAIKYYLKTGKKFIYLRRYKTEFDKVDKLISSLAKDEDFEDYILSIKGKKFYICRKNKCMNEDGDIIQKELFNDKNYCGDCIPLSITPQLKSMDFEGYYYMIYDEYRIIKSNIHYIPNEINVFLEWLETFARLRDFRCLLLGNNLTSFDPYFIYWELTENKNRIAKFQNKMIAVQYYTNEEYIKAKKLSPLGKLISGTKYGNYAIENETLIGNSKFIKKKNAKSFYAFTIVYRKENIHVWLDYKEGEIYCTFQQPNSELQRFHLTKEDMSPNMMFLKAKNNSHYMRMLKDSFEGGYLYYANSKVEYLMDEAIKLLNI